MHYIDQALKDARDHKQPQETKSICDQLESESVWFTHDDWLNFTQIRAEAAFKLGRKDLCLNYLRLMPDSVEVMDYKYRTMIEHGFYQEALKEISRIYEIYDDRKWTVSEDVKKAELHALIKLSDARWQREKILQQHWQTSDKPTWHQHKNNMLNLHCKIVNTQKLPVRSPLDIPQKTVAYLVSNLSENPETRFRQGCTLDSRSRQALYRTHLLATCHDHSDQKLQIWSGYEDGVHPEVHLPSLLDQSVDHLDLVSLKSPCHNLGNGAGCIQTIRDLLRWHPDKNWNYRFLKANYSSMCITGSGEEHRRPLHGMFDTVHRVSKDWSRVPEDPSEIQLDTYELNLYPNMRFGCFNSHEDMRTTHLDGAKPHNLVPNKIIGSMQRGVDRIKDHLQKKMTRQAIDTKTLQRTRLSYIDNLERTCSLHLCKIQGQWQEQHKVVMEMVEDLPEVTTHAVENFSQYLFNGNNDISPEMNEKQYKHSIAEADRKAGIHSHYLHAAINHCHACWLRQQWFPSDTASV